MKKIFFLLFLITILFSTKQVNAISLSDKLVGKFLLQVDNGGRVWYVSPKDKRTYEVTFAEALLLFQQHSTGITNKDLNKIPIAPLSMDPHEDTDDDGFDNKTEAEKNFDPFSNEKIIPNQKIINNLKGRFLLQTQDKGRIWYVDFNGQRWEIKWNNLMTLFKKLALGIKTADMENLSFGAILPKWISPKDYSKWYTYDGFYKYTSPDGNSSLSYDYIAHVNCGSKTCFEKAFKECIAGTIFLSNTGDAISKTTILNKENNQCKVEFIYDKFSFNKKLQGKKMDCIVDTKLNHMDAIQLASWNTTKTCTGELVTIINDIYEGKF